MATRKEKILTSLKEAKAWNESISQEIRSLMSTIENDREPSDKQLATMEETAGEASNLSSELLHLLEIITNSEDD
jgi:DNA anti-recombination protein RmuC